MRSDVQLSGVSPDWDLQRLADVFESQLGKMLSKKARSGISPKPYLRNLNVQWGVVDTSDVIRMDFNEQEMQKFRLRNGDLLMCEGGEPGRTAIWRDEIAECYYQKAIHRLRPIDGRALPEFFLYWFRYAFDISNVYGVAGASSTIAHLPAAQLRSLIVPVPPLKEQRQIAAVLSAVQRAIERQERLIALTAELKKALMHKLFTEGTRGEPLKQTEIGLVPESWELVRLDQIATIERGKFAHRPRNAPEFYGGAIPFVQTGDVSQCDGRIRRYTQTLNDRGLAISRMFPRGTILITIAANIGFTGILEFDSACTDSLVAITPTQGDCAKYLNYYLQTQQPVMDRLAPQGTQKNINIQFLKPWPLPRPSKDEQAVIADSLKKVDSKRRAHEKTRDTLSALFRSVMHNLMTAQVRAHDLDLSQLVGPD